MAGPESASFAHLHLHTEFSMLDGAARVEEVVKRAAADGQPAIAITDHGNMYGVLDFYKAANAAGVKPIIGIEAYMAAESRLERPLRRGRLDDTGGDADEGDKLYYHLTLLAESDRGYKNLLKLSSEAYLSGYWYKPRCDWELLEQLPRGRNRHYRVPRRAGQPGPSPRRRRAGHRPRGPVAGDIRQGKPVRRAAGPRHRKTDGKPTRSSSKLPGISARRCWPPTTAITRPATTTWPTTPCCACRRARPWTTRSGSASMGLEHYLKTAAEMRALFSELPEACDNTLWVAERADVTIELGKPKLPAFPLPPQGLSARTTTCAT